MDTNRFQDRGSEWTPRASSFAITLKEHRRLPEVLHALEASLAGVYGSNVVRTDDRGAAVELYVNAENTGYRVRFSGDGGWIPAYTEEDQHVTGVTVGQEEYDFLNPDLQPERINRMYVNDLLISAASPNQMLTQREANGVLEHLQSTLEVLTGYRFARYGWNG
tara:strand:- start:221 stop:712 length:492 start_codon:yes stop_codon:yes gene_type:complete